MQNKAKITTPDLTKERLDKLKELLPELFSCDGNLNIQNLYDLANKYSSAKKEKYEFNWAGKLQCQKLALEPTNSCLMPNIKKSINFDKTQNIIIEGDNLEVLKTLYQPYFEKIKCIYIDPPYNTGKDFIYNDKRDENQHAYWQRSGAMSDGVKLETNPESTGRKHSLWCSFIYPRLMLARNLLSQDGVIFVSIDDNEVHNLRKMMDEVFGEENFVGDVIWNSKYTTSNDAKYISRQHEYILIYAKYLDSFEIGLLDRTEEMNNSYKNPDNDPKGKWKSTPLHAKSGSGNYVIDFSNGKSWTAPQGRYPRYSKSRLLEIFNEGALYFNKNGGIDKKTYLSEVKQGKTVGTVWSFKDVSSSHQANEELASFLNKGMFDNPKPSNLISNILKVANSNNSQILDFFAGSGTTAHATLKLNAEEKIKYALENYSKLQNQEITLEQYLQGLNEVGNRKFILTQLPEYTDEKSEAFKTGYKTISAICIERVKRAGQKIIEEIKAEKKLNDVAKNQIINSLDIGFKTYELSDTNIDKAYYEMNSEILENYLKNSQNFNLFDNEKTNLLYEIAIKNGFDLSLNFTKIESIKDNEIYQVNANNRESALICVDQEIKISSIQKIILETSKNNRSWQFFCFDNSLSATVKTNLKSKIRVMVI
jgi:adenine-specific DNA-methyltransferase